ncbi:MAG: Sec-independent protein translocase subunit TatB [Propionibacterium sp.]|nr:Sec-independent protein translocase subunit TatB [Propionibacterium sp.]
MIPHEIFGIGASELVLLLVLGVIMFGPEKLPEISRKAARVVHAVRLLVNQAMGSLREELGPEYKDLQLADLNPKTLVRKTLLADIEDDIDDIKRELDGVRADLTGAASDVNHELGAKNSPTAGSSSGAGAAAAAAAHPEPHQMVVPWDDEAT